MDQTLNIIFVAQQHLSLLAIQLELLIDDYTTAKGAVVDEMIFHCDKDIVLYKE